MGLMYSQHKSRNHCRLIVIALGLILSRGLVAAEITADFNTGIGVSVSPSAGTALITDNLITDTKDGAIRAMKGPTPIGPDFAHHSAKTFRNLTVYANVAR